MAIPHYQRTPPYSSLCPFLILSKMLLRDISMSPTFSFGDFTLFPESGKVHHKVLLEGRSRAHPEELTRKLVCQFLPPLEKACIRTMYNQNNISTTL